MKGHHKQYGIKHYVYSTIHSAIGDKLTSVETSLSVADDNYSMWDQGQLLVRLSHTKLAKDAIFLTSKESTLNALVHLL